MKRNLALSLLAVFVLAFGLLTRQSAADDAAANTLSQAEAEQLIETAQAGRSLCSGTHGSYSGHCSDGWYDQQCANLCLSLYPENGGAHGCFDNSNQPCEDPSKCCMCME